jgi:hypothetical protein
MVYSLFEFIYLSTDFLIEDYQNTAWWMWNHPDFPRQAFENAAATQQNADVPFPAHIVTLPSRAATRAERLDAAKKGKKGEKPSLDGFQVRVAAQPPGTQTGAGNQGGAATLGRPVAPPLVKDKRTKEQLKAEIANLSQNLSQAHGGMGYDNFPFPFMPQPPWEPEPDDIYAKSNAGANIVFKGSRPMISDDASQEASWHGVHILGEGSYGRAGLWVQTDSDGNIVDVSSELHFQTGSVTDVDLL